MSDKVTPILAWSFPLTQTGTTVVNGRVVPRLTGDGSETYFEGGRCLEAPWRVLRAGEDRRVALTIRNKPPYRWGRGVLITDDQGNYKFANVISTRRQQHSWFKHQHSKGAREESGHS